MTDITRDAALLQQQGIRDAKVWSFGPFQVYRMDFPHSLMHSVGVTLGPWCVSLALTKAHRFPRAA